MPHLKKKINSARKSLVTNSLKGKASPPKEKDIQETIDNTKTEPTDCASETTSKRPSRTVKRDQSKPSSKNIVKNFGKAMCSFASSELSMPYYQKINASLKVNIEDFQDYIHKKRDLIDSIDSLRTLLLIGQSDDDVMIGYKKIFQEISIVFIKYFSVNWIFQGKMSHKQAHLKARYKMLRRVQNPLHFTYFKDFSR